MDKNMSVGKIAFEKNRFFLEVEGKREEIPVAAGDEGRLKEMVGQEVQVLYSEPKRAVVGLVGVERIPFFCYVPWPPWPPPCFMCYLPPYWLIRGVERQVQENLARRFLEEGVISAEVFERLR
jgi:hypothetical protein